MHRVRLLRLQTIISTITFLGVSVLSGASIAFNERTAAATCSSFFLLSHFSDVVVVLLLL